MNDLIHRTGHWIKCHPIFWHVVAYLVICVALALGALNYKGIADDVAQFNVDLRNGLVSSCQENGNSLREEVNRIEETLVAVLAAARTDPVLYPPPPVTPEEKNFIRTVEKGQRVLQGVPKLPCEELYPEPPEHP